MIAVAAVMQCDLSFSLSFSSSHPFLFLFIQSPCMHNSHSLTRTRTYRRTACLRFSLQVHQRGKREAESVKREHKLHNSERVIAVQKGSQDAQEERKES